MFSFLLSTFLVGNCWFISLNTWETTILLGCQCPSPFPPIVHDVFIYFSWYNGVFCYCNSSYSCGNVISLWSWLAVFIDLHSYKITGLPSSNYIILCWLPSIHSVRKEQILKIRSNFQFMIQGKLERIKNSEFNFLAP